MKLKRQSRFHHEVATGALNDIMFFLLLFFLIVATVSNPQVIRLALPNANAATASTGTQVKLQVMQGEQYEIGGQVVNATGLESAVQSAVKGIANPVVVVGLDPTVDVQHLVDVLDLGMRIHVKMVLQTAMK
jgi:biopolymer transport protein ExbD